MPTKRSVARGSARIVAGIAGIAVAGASIVAATWLPLPSFTAQAPSSTVTPRPADQQLVCPGPLLQLAADSADATGASAFDSVSPLFGSGDGSVSTGALKAPDDSKAGSFGGPTLLTLPVPGGATKLPLVAGSQAQAASQDDVTGLAASACSAALRSSWLVAGSNDLGQTSLVLLSNPSAVQATVDLAVFGESGPIQAPGAQGILVEPGTQRVVALAGIAPDAKAPVVHVTSRGGSIAASLQQSVVRGLDPDGVELASATAAPAKQQIISGVTLAAAAASGGSESAADTAPALRVLVPGDTAAKVRVGIVGEKGTSGGTSASATVQPKTAQEIPLDGLVNGSFTVTVDSDQPVVVAVRTSTAAGKAADFAWFSASRPLTGDTMVAVSKGPGAVLHLTNPSAKDVTVSVAATGATAKDVVVAARGAVAVPIAKPAMYTLGGASGLLASVSYAGSGLSSSFPIEPPAALASPITVYPR